MSFQNLLDGDCGGQNPLVKIGGHFTQDPSFRQEKVHPLPPDFNQADLLVHEFLEDKIGQNVQTFRMDELYRELRDMESTAGRSSISQAPNVAQLASEETSSLWSEQFANSGASKLVPQINPGQAGLPAFQGNSFQPAAAANAKIPAAAAAAANAQVPAAAAATANAQIPAAAAAANAQISKDDKLKPVQSTLNDLSDTWSIDFERIKHFDESQFGLGKEWVENFLKNGENEGAAHPGSATEKKEEAGSSKFIKFMQTGKNQEQGENSADWSEEFSTQDIDPSEMMRLNNVWQDEARANKVDSDDYSHKFWKKLQSEWEKMSEQDGEMASWEREYSEFIDPFKEYRFENENPMKELESPFEEGLRKLEENDLPSAVLCFEAAAQAEPNNPIVWQYLGTTQAENEQDPFAIAALKRAITLQNDNLVALMSLAISYTNENYQNQACQMLREWIYHNPKYSDLVKRESLGPYQEVSSLLSPNIFNEVRDLYIRAANKYPFGEIDPDVQCGLGVLFNLSDEHDNAVDCFKAALQARPKDSRMWNRLGATLANGNRSEEAVDAYYNSLHLSPGYIRARYNIGITCINLGANKEAAEHLLTALNQQSKVSTSRGRVGTMSDSIWTTLKFVVNLLGKYELIPAVDARDLATLNREFKVK